MYVLPINDKGGTCVPPESGMNEVCAAALLVLSGAAQNAPTPAQM
jgi:hypothetical protein